MSYGEGSLFQRKTGPRQGEWVKRFQVDGKWHATSWKQKPTRAMVTARIAELSRTSPPPGESVAAFLDRWLRDGTTHLRGRTVRGYRRLVETSIAPSLGHLGMSDLSTPVVQRWVNEGASAHALAVLRAALSEAVRWGLVDRNVARMVKPHKPPPRQTRVLSLTEAQRLLRQVRGDRLEALWVLAIYTGMRQGEILGLQWESVDLKKGTLHVCRSLWWMPASGGRVPVLTEPKTNHSDRMLTISGPVADALAEHRKAHLLKSRDGLVFTKADGTALEPSTVYDTLQRHLKAAGLPKIRFHDLRHSTASLLIASGMDAATVSAQLGHSSVATTMSIYAHAFEHSSRDVAERMGRLLGESVSETA